MTTPRFGEIAIDSNDSNTTIATKDFWDSILTGMKLDKGVWIIWYEIGQHYRTKMATGLGNISSEVCIHDIYLIDNYCNKYKFSANHDQLLVLQKKEVYNSYTGSGNTAYLFPDKRGCKFETPLTDEEITYIKKYCTIVDTERFDVFKHKMADYFSLQSSLAKLGSMSDVNKPLEDKIDKLLRHIEAIETTNKSQSKVIESMENKITELQKKHTDDSGFITYLKKLFAWN